MSQFLPETPPSAVQQADFKPTAETPTLEGDIALMQRILSAAVANPSQIPSDFLAYLIDFIQTQRLNIPIGQVVGFSQFTQGFAQTLTHEATTSTSYTNLATVGPQILGLSDGSYNVMYGCWLAAGASGAAAYMNVQVDGVTLADDTTAIIAPSGSVFSSSARAFQVSLTGGGGHSLVAKYRSSVGTSSADFQNRWLIAQKFSNR